MPTNFDGWTLVKKGADLDALKAKGEPFDLRFFPVRQQARDTKKEAYPNARVVKIFFTIYEEE
jgi:hypothetical protein